MKIFKLFVLPLCLGFINDSFGGCNDGNVKGLPPFIPSNAQCVSDSVDVGPSAYAYVDEPPCPTTFGATSISSFVQSQISSAVGNVASSYGGPLLGYVASVTADNVLHSVENFLGRDAASTNSMCKELAVKVPTGGSIVTVIGVAEDATGRTVCGAPAYCGGIGWSSIRNNGVDGDKVYATALNWSGDRTRHFELFVYYR